MLTVAEFEEKIWEIDGIRIVIRMQESAQVDDYGYKNAATANWSTTKWLERRVTPCLRGHEVVVIDGSGGVPHGRTLIQNVKNTYKKS